MNAQSLGPATQGAIHYLSLVLLRCYQLYSQQPTNLWRELHTLFLFAEQNQLLKAAGNNGETIEGAYVRILLTACANPYQLRQREIEQMFDALTAISSVPCLQPFARDSGLYYIDLTNDNGPQNVALATQTPTEHWRSLQLEQIVSQLQEELRAAGQVQVGAQRTPMQQLGAPLLRHLVRAFGNLTSRAFSRTPATGTVKAAIGLSATHFLLNGDEHAAAAATESGELLSMEGSLRGASIMDDERTIGRPMASVGADPFNKMYLMKTGNHSEARDPPPARSFVNNAEVKYEFQAAAIVNISPGGYCLALRGNIPNQTQTGEIVGLMEQDNDGTAHWNIGTIRWMKRVPDAALQIGIQLIAPNARPVTSQVRNSQMSSATFQRSLLLPALKGIGQPATLITSPMPYAVNQKVRVKDGVMVSDVRLAKQVAASASFKQFQFEETLAPKEEVVEKPNRGGLDNFDTVWELI